MDNSAHGTLGSREAESKKRSYDGKMVNGERPVARKESPAGAPAVNAPASRVGSANESSTALPGTTASQMAELPPDILHITSDQYHSLSRMIQRISQDCYNDLTEVLGRMSELKQNQSNGISTNGIGSHAMSIAQDNSETNKQKKLLLMKFAYENRAKFIKLLVLTEWGKKASGDVSKLIDLFAWSREQSTAMDNVDYTLERLKIESNSARQYNPDIRTALEILGTKKAQWIPDMGFIPPEPMSSDRALKLLRSMNTSLSIRLFVHEKVPSRFSKWHVKDGRVTFTVDGEFELDLMTLVEDASDPWMFVDFRLLFSPAPAITVDSAFMNRIRDGVDEILRTDGLEQCYKYLHNFTLTHKISVLATQANQLLRADWAGAFRTEFAHRQFVIQYWPDRPGKKNWIEIGIASNRPKDGRISWRGPPVPSLAVRWFRQGVEVKDVKFDFDWVTLSVENMVKRVISLHIAYLLQATQRNLSPGLKSHAFISEMEPSDCKLEASIGSSASRTTLTIEPVTGRAILKPVTPISSAAENAINRSLDASAAGTIVAELLARSFLDHVQRVAQQIAWRPVARQALRKDVVKTAVRLDVLGFMLFRPRGWTLDWTLATIVDASSESWWICKLGVNGTTIEHAQRITMERHGHSFTVNRATLRSIERVAVHTLSYYATTSALAKEAKSYRLSYDFTPPPRGATLSRHAVQGWVLHLKTSDLLTLKPGEPAWLGPDIRVTCVGFRADYRNVWHIARGTMAPAVAADMKKLMSASAQKSFIFSEGGAFAILLCTPFGQSVSGELKLRLRDLDRLRSFGRTLQTRKMVLISSSLQHIQFQYAKSFSVTVVFEKGDDIQVKFGSKNPHNRIRNFLVETINERSGTSVRSGVGDDTGFDRFCTALVLTRPALMGLDEIETQQHSDFGNPIVHTHRIGYYRIGYNNPPCSFDVSLRVKGDKVFWLIEDNEHKPPEFRSKIERTPNFSRADNLKAAMQKLLKETGARWFSARAGLIADMDGVRDALKRLHETVTSCRVEGGVKPELTDSKMPIVVKPKQANGYSMTNRPGVNGVSNARQPSSNRLTGIGNRPMKNNNNEPIVID